MNYTDVELLDGRTVHTHRPPTRRIIDRVEKLYPRPQPPIVTEKAATKEISMSIDDDPTYLRELAEWERLTNEKVDEMGSLCMFKDLDVPDDWDVEEAVGAEMRFFDPDWAPREGPMGRKLDYIQWDILGDVMNSHRVTEALRELSGIDLEEVERNEASFRDQVEGSASQ